MEQQTSIDPAERGRIMRLFYSNWHPTRAGRWINRFWSWWSGVGLPPRLMAAIEVPGRRSGRRRSQAVVITRWEGQRYLVSMLGPGSEWVKNVDAANGAATIRQGRRHPVHLTLLPARERAPILREYVRIAPGGRIHFPVTVGAPLGEFEALANSYPVYRIDPA